MSSLKKVYEKCFKSALKLREKCFKTTWWFGAGLGTYLLSRVAWIVHYHWRAEKSINFILKFDLYLITRKSDFSWLTLWVPAYHGASPWRDVVLWWVTKILMRAISNVHVGRIWPAGRGFPTPGLGISQPVNAESHKIWFQLLSFCIAERMQRAPSGICYALWAKLCHCEKMSGGDLGSKGSENVGGKQNLGKTSVINKMIEVFGYFLW